MLVYSRTSVAALLAVAALVATTVAFAEVRAVGNNSNHSVDKTATRNVGREDGSSSFDQCDKVGAIASPGAPPKLRFRCFNALKFGTVARHVDCGFSGSLDGVGRIYGVTLSSVHDMEWKDKPQSVGPLNCNEASGSIDMAGGRDLFH